jgi:nucleoporin NUP1
MDDEDLHSPERSETTPTREPLQRSSSSFFGALKNFVVAPLYWLNGEQKRDGGEKRSLPSIGEVEDDRAAKKQRRSSPSRGERYTPGSSFDEARNGLSKLSFQQVNGMTPIPELPPPSLSRSSTLLMNVDSEGAGPSTTFRNSQQWSMSNGIRSSSQEVTSGTTHSQQHHFVSRGSLLATPSSPYRMRKSLTPQPVPPLSPTRRDHSTSRSSLMWSNSSRASLSPLREFRREVRKIKIPRFLVLILLY